MARHLEARGNQEIALEPADLRQLKCVDPAVVHRFADAITTATGIPTRYPPMLASSAGLTA
jgi:hypothetical protein